MADSRYMRALEATDHTYSYKQGEVGVLQSTGNKKQTYDEVIQMEERKAHIQTDLHP